MGKFLQIRVSASTYRPEDVDKAWPRLCALAWPFAPRVAGPPMAERGVLELLTTLADRVRFALGPDALGAEFMQGLEAAEALRADLEAALADWDAARANRLSQELEAALDSLEGLAPETPFIVSNADAGVARPQGGRTGKGPSKSSHLKGILRFFKRES